MRQGIGWLRRNIIGHVSLFCTAVRLQTECMDKADASEPTSESGSQVQGVVIRSTGSWYDVQISDRVVPCTVRGKFRLEDDSATNPVAVGDHVVIQLNEDQTGVITEIKPRYNKLSRRAAGRRVGKEHVIVANVDEAWCVQSVDEPRFNNGFVDRFLVMAEAYSIPAGCIINKVDLLDDALDEEISFWQSLYQSIGYPVLMTSAETGENIDLLGEKLAGKTSVVNGPSGVGKTALLNALDPELNLKTGEISAKTRKGRHTTTYAALYTLSNGGFVVDTPGIREFGIWDMEPEDLGGFFIEMRPCIPECKFPSCTHDHEPGCAVIAAVEEGDISTERYHSYLNILDSLKLGEKDVGR